MSNVFHPTWEWQVVLEHHVLPKGLEIRLDLTTGQKRARIPNPWQFQSYAGDGYGFCRVWIDASSTQEDLIRKIAENISLPPATIGLAIDGVPLAKFDTRLADVTAPIGALFFSLSHRMEIVVSPQEKGSAAAAPAVAAAAVNIVTATGPNPSPSTGKTSPTLLLLEGHNPATATPTISIPDWTTPVPTPSPSTNTTGSGTDITTNTHQ